MRSLVLPLTLMAAAIGARAADDDDLALAYGDAATVSVASGYKQPLRRAPAVATVITAEDIRAMGASDLSQVLERVPGLHVSRSFYMQDPLYQLRGIQSDFSQQMLILIDGVRRQSPLNGGPEEIWISLPVEQIARIEVIRGPGSALYGADAFSGVIAISTWRGSERSGTQWQLQGGSYGQRATAVQHGGHADDWQWFAHLYLGRTDGQNEVLAADGQSGLDALFGTRASLAPGPLHMPHRDLDIGLNLGWQAWNLNASVKQRRDVGSGSGLAQTLSDRDDVDSRFSVLSLSYERAQWLPYWGLKSQLSLTHSEIDSVVQLFPPGAFGGAFPQGMLGAPGRSARVLAFETVASYQGLRHHHLRLGLGLQHSDVYAVRERKNFNFVAVPGLGYLPMPLGALSDVPSAQRYIEPRQRDLHYLLAQDEWQIGKDWALTLGLRHDRYSDFGATTNPRAALVWSARHDLTLKLLHGRAFRAPSFTELYTVNNPVALGDPSNRPERLNNTEVVLDWQPSATLQAGMNLFRYRWRNSLRLLANADSTATNRNGGGQKAHGMEAELRWQARAGLRVDASLAWQRATDTLSQSAVAQAPRRVLKLGLDTRLGAAWHLHAQALQVAERPRALGDARTPVKDLALLDLSLHWRRQAEQGWQARLSLNNALDADAREPSPAPGSIPNDFPLPRRTVALELRYGF